MNWLRKPAVLFLLIINLSSQPAFCQDLDEIVRFSDQLFAKGKYELAANEYNRALFFGSKEPDQICLKIANCYFKQQKFDQSIQFYDRTYFSSNADSIKTEAILGKSFALILEKNYVLALTEMMNIDSAKNNYHEVKLNFLRGIAYFGLHEDKLSETFFNKCLFQLSFKNDSVIKRDFYAIKKAEKRFNPRTAYFLSLVLPGTGQFYSGSIKEGLNSAILLDGLLFAAVLLAREYSTVTSFVTILPWFQRYYLGGANKAERLAHEKQLAKRNDIYQNILQTIEQAYSVKQIK
jgi:tetratricopeptide (TPR) repeat protein